MGSRESYVPLLPWSDSQRVLCELAVFVTANQFFFLFSYSRLFWQSFHCLFQYYKTVQQSLSRFLSSFVCSTTNNLIVHTD